MIATPFTLPCGQVVPNRLCKAAMTERLCRSDHLPNEGHHRLYKKWASSGAELHLSGNIMVDVDHLESAGNVVACSPEAAARLRPWTQIITATGSQFWAQLNHPGRQTNYLINMRPVSASSVWLKRGGLFLPPRSLKPKEIKEIIFQFVRAAAICLEGGFTGIQIHAAHGYLISQFLSPLTNRRTDEWGGTLANRARLLSEIVREVKNILPADIPISVKLNSADFQRGGFSEDDSMEVIQLLEKEVDLVEISGGTYQKQAMMGEHTRESTAKREAYFLAFATKIRRRCRLPIMVTGGFRSRTQMTTALEEGALDLIGLARPFCTESQLISGLLDGTTSRLTDYFVPARSSINAFSAEGGYYARQIVLMAADLPPDLKLSGDSGARFLMKHELKKSFANRLSRWKSQNFNDLLR